MRKERINVTKTFLPPIEEYQKYLQKIWQNNQLTNQGPFLTEFEGKIKKILKVKYFLPLSNGTLALQLALDSLGICEGEIITTPFSYVATLSSILWQRCEPVFVDIETKNFCIDADKIEQAITPRTKAILAVHVFGYACNVEKIKAIAEKHNLKVIYDGAHAFGAEYKNKSLLSYGDIATCSFHATKIFHTAEGGGCLIKDKKTMEKMDLARRFGHIGDNHYQLGINAKNSELHAIMGLCNLDYVKNIIKNMKRASNLYDKLLKGNLMRPALQKNTKYNYGYYPVVFKNEKQLLKVFAALKKENIFPRRYFYPSLNTLPYLKKRQKCPISEDISRRIACLPLYNSLKEKDIKKIAKIINEIIC